MNTKPVMRVPQLLPRPYAAPRRKIAAGLTFLSVPRNRKSPLAHLLQLIVVPVMLASGCGQNHVEDTLVLTDASVRTGVLARCNAALCVLSGTEIPRSTIRYIGLGAKLPPPSPRDPGRDEVHQIDKSIHPGPLVSVDADTVVAGGTKHERRVVAWIHLGPGKTPAASGRTWQGTIGGKITTVNSGVTCTGPITGSMTVLVAADGTVTGGQAEVMYEFRGDPNYCQPQPLSGPVFGGRETSEILEFAALGIPGVTTRKAGNRANGTFDFKNESSTVHWEFDLRCVNC